MNKGVVLSNERTDEGFLQLFAHAKRIENDRIAKRIYMGVCW